MQADWVLLLGAKQRNQTVSAYDLTPEQADSLKAVR